MPTRQAPVALIGAGIAGLSCARALRAAGVPVQLFDKSRGPAGRMSTRWGEGWQCDHGAQYFTARDSRFQAELQTWLAAGVAAPWAPRLQCFGDKPTTPGAEANDAVQRYVGAPQMTSPARHVAQDLTLHLNAPVTGLLRQPDGACRLRLAPEAKHPLNGDGTWPQAFSAVLLALPAPQVPPLLQGGVDASGALLARAQAARMRGSWALMLRYAAPLNLGFDAAFVNEGPLRWVARDSSKPGRPVDQETWLLHAQAEWSEAHLELSAEAVTPLLLRAFAALGANAEPEVVTAHRWRYADTAPETLSPEPGFAWAPASGLGLCGDWLHGGKVEGAWLSGLLLAQALLANRA